MSRFLAIYHGAADDAQKPEVSDEQQAEFLNAWATWARNHADAIVDNGSPLFRKRRVTAEGSDDFTDSKTGYAIVEAASQDEADGIFAEHPHLRLFQGNWIEVLECPPMPGP
ncbi:hypothetical protein [Pseudosporangium ferrugineum]|uniref:YCII-related domain-containing protein n=1 Tax=Pseudosporangium ferrugineum TaxID=439699 RepID=A0A2T0RQV6_9ACTN|nr:hypothetical protein [Pseudosporangium ferrugineum]PRY23473.1 hypothetical protein CLV70_115206 [Pseudosporangium ferrugineum]